jgi:hypothetical protein
VLPSVYQAFRHYCSVFSIEGTFLIGKYKGTLLIAISVDTNNKLVPLGLEGRLASYLIGTRAYLMSCKRRYRAMHLCIIIGVLDTLLRIYSGRIM